MDGGDAPVGQQISDYASQVAAINQQISALPRSGGDLLPADKDNYGRLKAQRDALTDKAAALTARVKKAGASAPDFKAEIAKAAKPKEEKVADIAPPETPAESAFADASEPVTASLSEEAPQPIEAESADGVVHEFPAGTKDEVIDRVMKQYAQEQRAPLPPQAPGEARPEGTTRPEPTEKDLPPAAAAMRPGTTSLASGGAESVDPQQAFADREKLEKDLRAKGIDPKTDPAYREALRKQAQGQNQNIEEGAQFVGLGGEGGLAQVAKGGIKAGLKKVGQVAGQAEDKITGAAAANKAAQSLKTDMTGQAASVAGTDEQTAATAAKRAEALKAQQTQLQQTQPAVAAQRAEAATAAPKQGQTAGLEPERVVAKAREKVADLEKQYTEAGAAKEDAARLAEEHQGRIEDTEKAVDDLDKELLAKPGTTADELGGKLRAVTEQLHDKYSAQRSQMSGYGKALEDAGDELRVDTTGTRQLIDANLKDVRNPSLQRVLTGMKDLLTTDKGDVAHEGLSMRAAESLRKYINGVIQSKMFGDQAVDRETLHVLGDVKKSLDGQMLEYKPFAEASRKWAELSRPLDIVERKGALKKVLDKDPVSTDYALTDAQVVGQAITKARSGSPALARLAEENPSIKIPARLYFTQDLFGKEAVPTVAGLRTWLKTNEQPLRQLGLYDEFRDIRVAKETAQKAVETAKGVAKETMAQAKVAEREERQVADRLKRAQSLRDAAKKRAEPKGKPTTEDLKAQSAKRAGEGSKRLESRAGEASKSAEKAAGSADTYRRFETELKSAPDKAVPGKTREFIGKLRRDGKIDDETYGELLKKINAIDEAHEKSEVTRKRLRTLAYIGIASAGLPYVYRKLSDLF